MNDIFSFYQLISKYQIEIPIIQRDYAQGRDNAKAADVRKSLVNKMICAVETEKSLFFDFVYGRIDGNKFVPFDGQQRLTTLFLFHKYVFEKCQLESDCAHKGNCICIDILSRFSYATRQSSREFCEKIVLEHIIPLADIKISENIKNQSWFYPDWQKDPTVMGMLAMLDEIHHQMKRIENYKTIAERLTSGCNCPITFHFVNMGEHKLSDETYVKMNARGKQLTPFENYKASLEQYFEEKKKENLLNRLKDQIDGTWLDLFWDIANEGKIEKELPDTLMMSFFNRHFMNVWQCSYANYLRSKEENGSLSENKKQTDWDTINNRIQKEMPLYPSKDDFVSFEIYSSVMYECGAENCLLPIFNICDALYEKKDIIKKDCQAVWNRKEVRWNLYQGDKNNDNRETYPSRVAFYALMKYFGTNTKDTTDTTSLSQWMRIVWNIIENSTIDSEEPYHAALILIDELSEYSHDIYKYLKYSGAQIKSNFAKVQVKEEIDKAKQIIDGGDTWKEAIIKAESYTFFKGAIRFLFQDADGNVTEESWGQFDKKWENAQKYFDENGVKEEYKTELTKVLVLQCDNWDEQLYEKQIFNPNANTWKWILCSSIWKAPVHKILSIDDLDKLNPTSTLSSEGANKYILNILKDLPYGVFISKEPNGRFRWYGRLGYYRPHGQSAITFDWGDFHRNRMLRELVNHGAIIDSNIKVSEFFFWGWNIPFKIIHDNRKYDFQWDANGNIYLLEKGLYKVKREDPKEYYCFNADGITEIDDLLGNLYNLIK